MREIKFRAWDKRNHTWCTAGMWHERYHQGQRFFGITSSEDVELMQFTGLLDKNGKEIYEGDITEPQSWIAWCDKCCSFEFFLRDFDCSSCDRDVFWCEIVEDREKLEVIGNIYENPELLK